MPFPLLSFPPWLQFISVYQYYILFRYVLVLVKVTVQVPVEKVDNAIHRINLYPMGNEIGFPKFNTYPVDCAIQRLNNRNQNNNTNTNNNFYLNITILRRS